MAAAQKCPQLLCGQCRRRPCRAHQGRDLPSRHTRPLRSAGLPGRPASGPAANQVGSGQGPSLRGATALPGRCVCVRPRVCVSAWPVWRKVRAGLVSVGRWLLFRVPRSPLPEAAAPCFWLPGCSLSISKPQRETRHRYRLRGRKGRASVRTVFQDTSPFLWNQRKTPARGKGVEGGRASPFLNLRIRVSRSPQTHPLSP